MGCNCSCKKEITGEQQKILAAMAGLNCACGTRDISTATGLDSKALSSQLKTLKTKGYIGSPARCKYEITEAGKAAL
ncbi:MAG: hypothetical protein HY885_17510 [Deltaproteobacteria bacterium]|nr:hypothetical protein [Deltaproteobacteria bacterium]